MTNIKKFKNFEYDETFSCNNDNGNTTPHNIKIQISGQMIVEYEENFMYLTTDTVKIVKPEKIVIQCLTCGNEEDVTGKGNVFMDEDNNLKIEFVKDE